MMTIKEAMVQYAVSLSEDRIRNEMSRYDFDPKLRKTVENRRKWRHGFAQCPKCHAKLMFYLSKGHSLTDVIEILGVRHPEIKNIRRYAMNAIRQTTGLGIFDDYIIKNNLWTLKNPVLAPPAIAPLLEAHWKILTAKGNVIMNFEKAETQILEALRPEAPA
jgi:hypothetical protein